MTTIHFKNGEEIYLNDELEPRDFNYKGCVRINDENGRKIYLRFRDILYVEYTPSQE